MKIIDCHPKYKIKIKKNLNYIRILTVAFLIFISGCIQVPDTNKNTIGKPSQNSSTHVVNIIDFEFAPTIMTIKSGETVTFKNKAYLEHSIISTFGFFDSGKIEPGNNFTYEFDEKGVYEYECEIHSNFHHGLIIVK